VLRALTIELTRLAARNLDFVIILMDRESRTACPGQLASDLRRELLAEQRSGYQIEVVIKDRTLENWLVADLQSLRSQPKRFKVSQQSARSIAPNKADNVDAFATLKACAIGPDYDKVKDCDRILSRADPLRMAANSRSFRVPEMRRPSRLPQPEPGAILATAGLGSRLIRPATGH
jgi:hypothetical protein